MKMVQGAERIEELLAQQPRVALSQLPTPLVALSRISRMYGQRVYCKRDDLTGFAFGGNKTRKLEYLLAEAQRAGADTIVAVGAVQSNFCRVAAAAAARAEMACYLVLGGAMPRVPTGNVALDEILGAKLKFCASQDWNDWEAAAASLAEDLRAQGKKVLAMPIGGSTEIGVLGYVAAMAELLRDFDDVNDKVHHIVLASSSGGTQAGLLVGKALSGWRGEIWGVSVAYDKVTLANEIFDIASQTAARFGVSIDPRNIHVDDSFLPPGYGRPNAETLEAIETFARLEGFFVDRVYSGKAAAALLSYLDEQRFSPAESLCFLHTGGSVELFAQRD